ncbi:MAG: alpha/beta hydrolase [Pseudomonadota bacterium]
MQLNYRDTGTRNGPAIALLHGFMSSNAQWLANEARLGAHYRLIEFELWGHGESPLPEPDQISVAGYLKCFEAVREQLGIERWYLIGQSYGAGLMLSYAMEHPHRCPAVIVTNSRSAFSALEDSPTRRKANAPPASDPTTVEGLRKLPYHPIHARRFPEAVKAALVASADRMDIQTVRLGGQLGGHLNFSDRLDHVPVPVMIANGAYERAFQTDLARLRARYDNLWVVDLEGGHSVNIEAAHAFDEACRSFLSEVASGERQATPQRR